MSAPFAQAEPQTTTPSSVNTVTISRTPEPDKPSPILEPSTPQTIDTPPVVQTHAPQLAPRLTAYSATGLASWYGKRFHGRRTSSGERYNMTALTAAHLTLPIPSYAKITNLRNGKSVIVRINDRGPFNRNRLVDVSFATANALGFVREGKTEVRIEQILPDPPSEQISGGDQNSSASAAVASQDASALSRNQ